MAKKKASLGLYPLLLFCGFCSGEVVANDPNCTGTVIGLCTPTIIELIETDIISESSSDSTGTTTIETTTVTTTTTTTTNETSGDILDSSNGFVNSSASGSMDVDWGGQGPASMPTGSSCGDLGTDKCAEITGSGSSTSTMGVAGMGTTFIQTVDVQNLNMEDKGGRVNYIIKVHKQDDEDSIYMHITGRDGNTTAFAGTDLLSAAGVATGYAEYTGGFDFGGSLTLVIIEVGGRDINLAIGPVFDDVSVSLLWNVVNTIVSMHITTIETFVAMGGYSEEVIDIAEDIFDNNDFNIDPNGKIEVTPNFDDNMSGGDSYETVEMELEMPDMDMNMDINMDFDTGPITSVEVTMEDSIEMDMEFEMEMPDVSEPEGTDLPPPNMDKPPPEEIEMASANMASDEMPEVENMADEEPSTETEMEPSKPETEPEPQEDIQNDQGPDAEEQEPKPEVEAKPEEPEKKEEEPQKKAAEEEEKEPEVKVAAKEEPKEKEQEEVEEKPKEEPKKTKAQQKQEQKQKAGSKIVAKMGDKGRYDADNQIKTLLVMQVLGNTKTFFENQKTLKDTQGFFSDLTVPDNSISDNNYASFIMFGGSNVKMDALIDMQYKN
jgi:hypothetical protein